jgi:hypothetical protein
MSINKRLEANQFCLNSGIVVQNDFFEASFEGFPFSTFSERYGKSTNIDKTNHQPVDEAH